MTLFSRCRTAVIPRGDDRRGRTVCLLVAATALLGLPLAVAHSGTVSSQSTLAATLDYNSNPLLAPSGVHSAEAAALVADLPVTYTGTSQVFDLIPRFRYAQTGGVSELQTDYEYVDADWRYDGERNSANTSAQWHRDSTFYNTFENAAVRGRDLPRVEETAGLAAQRALTERSSLQVTGSWDQVSYSNAPGTNFRLSNYTDVQGSIQYSRVLTERWTSNTSAGISRYRQLGSEGASENKFLQTSVSWVAAEAWSASAQLSYSRLNSTAQAALCCAIAETSQGFFLIPVIIVQHTSGNTLDYALSVEHHDETWNWSLSAARSVQATGLGIPLTQEVVSLGASRPVNERLTVASTLRAMRLSDALSSGNQLGKGLYYNAELNAYWQWTEHWTLGVQGVYHWQRALAQAPASSNVDVALTLTRALGRITF